MADIAPFRGSRYAPQIAGEMSKLIAPPYDVISSALRDMLFRQSDYNIARIIRADRDESDASGNPYAAAAALLATWRDQGVVAEDDTPGIYIYEQLFEAHERKFSRTGMVALVRLKEPGEGILPHENTLEGPRADRLELLRATHTQFGQVFGLYSDKENKIADLLEQAKTAPPLAQAVDAGNIMHRLWALTDPSVIAEIQEAMRDKDILIADGHHRYETALNYSRENPDCEAAKSRMMTLVNTSDEGLVVLPTHRLVKNLSPFDKTAFIEELRKKFQVLSYPGDSAAVRSAAMTAVKAHHVNGRHAFGLYLGNGNHHVLVLKNDDACGAMSDHSDAWRQLDVTMFHTLILENILGMTAESLEQQAHIEYVKDFPHTIDEAAGRVSSGDAQALFLLNPTTVEEVQAVAANRERMPQKSTVFYPKVYTGMVFYDTKCDGRV